MSLRKRLFLLVGGLFLCVLILSDFLGGVLMKKNLLKEESKFRQEVIGLNEEKRKNIEKFLKTSLIELQAHIDTLLEGISEYQSLSQRFTPSSFNDKEGTWVFSSQLLLNNKWLDFIQNSSDKQLLSLIIPDSHAFKMADRIPIAENIYWVVINTAENTSKICIGIPLGMNTIQAEGELSLLGARGTDLMILFDWKNPLFYDPSTLDSHLMTDNFFIQELFSNNSRAHLKDFFSLIASAGSYLQNGVKIAGKEHFEAWVKSQVLEKGKNQEIDIKKHPLCTPFEDKSLNEFLHVLQQREDQIIMMGAISALLTTEAFGSSPFDPEAPVGVVKNFSDSNHGEGFFINDVFYRNPIFNDSRYIQLNPAKDSCWSVSNSQAVILESERQKLFFGNTLRIFSKEDKNEKWGYLTLGFDVDRILLELALSINQLSFVTHDNKVVSGVTKEGEKLSSELLEKIPMDLLKGHTSGIFNWENKSYFYLQMTPFPQIDLHFYAVTLEENAFILIDHLDKGTKEIISKITLNMQILAVLTLLITLAFLHRLSLKITKPISILAKATHDVSAGKLEEIDLPKIPYSEKDEISSLYASFESMVRGLIEKEKVKGVLNKVVSPEIAQEILKGTIHLGGEEKIATVLFADIRSFTEMTQKMLPHEVIDLLNGCMTKISHIIDEFGGVIDKYVGDEVMALFGAPIAQEDSALHAVLCAIKMLKGLEEWNEERTSQGLKTVQMGIGIHTGIVVAGNMGAENRLNYTVLGRNVNLAARLCSGAKGMQILVSKDTLDQPYVKEHVIFEKQASMSFKGFEESIDVYWIKGLI